MAMNHDTGNWAELFPEHLIPNILELLLTSWVNLEKLSRDEHENPISQRFADKLRKDKNRTTDLPFKIRAEVQAIDTNGRIDILFDYTGTCREEVYFAFECKRLRIKHNQKLKPNTGEYIGNQGMMCFISGKYSAGLKHGGMIAYVMDGNTTNAIKQVEKAIQANKTQLKLSPESIFSAYQPLDAETVKQTIHNLLDNRRFTIYHVFLAV